MVTKLVYMRTGRVLAERLEVARTMPARMRGLLGRKNLSPGGGMMIERCASIHTFFMRFPIDVVFVDSNMVVTKAVENVLPWRLVSSLASRHVIELPGGTLASSPLAPGDALRIEESP